MKLSTYDIREEPDLACLRDFTRERGSWVIRLGKESSAPPLLAGYSFLACQIWIGHLEAAVTRFIKDNRQMCASCGAEWILLKSSVDVPKCPDCGLITQCNQG